MAFVSVVVVFLACKVGQNLLEEQPCFLARLRLKDPPRGGGGVESLIPFHVVKCGGSLDQGHSFLWLEAQPARHPVACSSGVGVQWD